MSGKDDWIKLTVRFKGNCVICGKEIAAGEGALWSKKEKLIMHVECVIANRKKSAREREIMELDCFVCRKAAGCLECSLEPDCDRVVVSQVCICGNCMDEGDAFPTYREAFLTRMNKLPKVKI